MALLIPAKVTKEVRRSGMPPKDWAGLNQRLERIARDPHASHPDVEPLAGGRGYRVRHGDWRAIYELNGGDVEVIKVGPRGSVYQ
jgi:mRNA interferase RelE/StbE